MYFVEVQNGKITAKGYGSAKTDDQLEVTEEIYSQLSRLPAEYVMDAHGKIISVMPAPEPPPQDPPVNQELADAYEAIAALYEETEALKARLAALEGGAA